MGGGKAQAGCSIAGCFAASVVIIFCFALTVGFMGGGSDSAAADDDAGSGKLTSSIEGTVTEMKNKGKTIKIPATKGKTAGEEYLPGMTFSKQCNSEEEKWYITMRWPYVKWRFNGTSALVDSATTNTKSAYAKVRVVVYNPKTKKSIITAICESGPAPWTGSSWFERLPSSTRKSLSKIFAAATNNPPSFWKGARQFDPPEADGRVSGLAPKALKTIGASANTVLEYGFAEDQNRPLGLIKE